MELEGNWQFVQLRLSWMHEWLRLHTKSHLRAKMCVTHFLYAGINCCQNSLQPQSKVLLTTCKLSLRFNWAPRHEGTRGRWVVSSTSRRLTRRERAHCTHWKGGWVGPRAVLDYPNFMIILHFISQHNKNLQDRWKDNRPTCVENISSKAIQKTNLTHKGTAVYMPIISYTYFHVERNMLCQCMS